MDKRRIIEKAHPLIIASINKYAASKGEFEDLYQEGVVVILEALEEYDEEKGVNLFYYLKLQLKFFYLNYGRYEKQVTSLNIPIDEELELIDLMADEGTSIEDIVIGKLTMQDTIKALQTLEHEEKYMVEQLILKGRILDDLAKELGISRTTLYRRKESVLKKIRGKSPSL